MTFTLGKPTNATLGSATTNALTIVEQPVVPNGQTLRLFAFSYGRDDRTGRPIVART